MTTRAFEDGLEAARAAGADTDGDRRLDVPGVEVLTSRNAGTYYCAHAFYVLARWSEHHAQHARGSAGPGVGFLHVPADDATTGDAPTTVARHEQTGVVIASALRGLLDAHDGRGELHVLLTGYGAFQGVVDNPTGAFVLDANALPDAMARAAGEVARELEPLVEGAEGASTARGVRVRRVRAGRLLVSALVLEVTDRALDADAPGSLPWALERFVPHVAISMGVHRSSAAYRVELLPTNGGLVWHERAARHVAGSPITEALRERPLLADAIERGARALWPSSSGVRVS